MTLTTLILVDFQRGMCDPDGPAGAGGLADMIASRNALENAATALEAARQQGTAVVHVRLAFEDGHINRTNRTDRFDAHESAGRFLATSKESEFMPQVAPQSGETQINKGSVSPFASSALLEQLAARGDRHIVLAGVATHLALESAAREASDRGFEVDVLEDACAAPSDAIHSASINAIASFANVITVDQFVSDLSSAASDSRQAS